MIEGLTDLERAILAKGLRKRARKVEKHAAKRALTRGDKADLIGFARNLRRRADGYDPTKK